MWKTLYRPLLSRPIAGAEWDSRFAVKPAAAPAPLAAVLPNLLDGKRELGEVYGVLLVQGHDPTDVTSALNWLASRGLLHEAPDSPAALFSSEERDFYRLQLAAFAEMARQFGSGEGSADHAGLSIQARLKTAVVVVTGSGLPTLEISRHLVKMGVGRLIVLDTGQADEDTIAAHDLTCVNPFVEVSVVRRPEDLSGSLGGVAPNVVIYAPEVFEEELARWLNGVSVRLRVPWLPYRQQGFSVEIGPLVIPGETACYVCYELRRKATGSAAMDSGREPLGSHVVLGADLVAIEAMKCLTDMVEPVTRGRLWRLDLVRGSVDLHPVLRLPRCPACGVHRQRPPRKLWEE